MWSWLGSMLAYLSCLTWYLYIYITQKFHFMLLAEPSSSVVEYLKKFGSAVPWMKLILAPWHSHHPWQLRSNRFACAARNSMSTIIGVFLSLRSGYFSPRRAGVVLGFWILQGVLTHNKHKEWGENKLGDPGGDLLGIFWCWCGAKRRVKRAQTREQGPPSAPADILPFRASIPGDIL